jgi:nucleotide-binding universal stress UspA family protein
VSFIHLFSVQTPAEFSSVLEAGQNAMRISQQDLQSELRSIQDRLHKEGIESDVTRRVGNVADILGGAILEQTPDLLLLGAYGYGTSDRLKLGSTAEHILRTAPCPVLTIGPRAILQAREAPQIEHICCAISSSRGDDGIFFAGKFAVQMGADLEVLHVGDPADKAPAPHKREYDLWIEQLHEEKIRATWTVLHGAPEETIAARAAKKASSMIIFGLHRIGNQMANCPDGVVSATIRRAGCPVMTVPLGRIL